MENPFAHPVEHPLKLDPATIKFPRDRDWSQKPRAEQTRLGLMKAAAAEIYEKGYHAAALSDILHRAGATKGALYHHFADKKALALAAMDYFIRLDLWEFWLEPFRQSDDPVMTLRNLIIFLNTTGVIDKGLKHGCPIVNLTEELGVQDEDFRTLIEHVNQEWREVLGAALRRGQEAGNVRANVDCEGTAMLILAIRHGVISTKKTSSDPDAMAKLAGAFFNYLDSLRPGSPAPTSVH